MSISTRGEVLTGNNVMIAGFVIQGSSSQTVVIVATGPSLVAFGITNPLPDPTLTVVRSSDQTTIATNDDWGSAANAAAIRSSGFAPSNSLESAILITLSPGAYTAIVSGYGGVTGVGVVAVSAVGTTTVTSSSCQTNNTADASFTNTNGYGESMSVIVDGTIYFTLGAGQTSATRAFSAGTHSISFLNASNSATACTTTSFTWSQCSSHSITCQGEVTGTTAICAGHSGYTYNYSSGMYCPNAYPYYDPGYHGYGAGCYASCPYVGDCCSQFTRC